MEASQEAEFIGSLFAYNTVKESHCGTVSAAHFAAHILISCWCCNWVHLILTVACRCLVSSHAFLMQCSAQPETQKCYDSWSLV